MPGRFRVSGKMPSFNLKGFKVNLNKLGNDELVNTARAWLKAVIVEIPTFTGTARGTFRPLGRFLKVSFPAGTRKSKRKSKLLQGTRFQLGFGAGAQYGQDFEFHQNNNRFEFNYVFNLPYIYWNSFGPGLSTLIKKTPWFAIQKGTAAGEKHIREKIPPQLTILFGQNMRARIVR